MKLFLERLTYQEIGADTGQQQTDHAERRVGHPEGAGVQDQPIDGGPGGSRRARECQVAVKGRTLVSDRHTGALAFSARALATPFVIVGSGVSVELHRHHEPYAESS